MKFTPLAVAGAFLIELERNDDARGFFARLWCRDEFAAHGIKIDVLQASISHNAKAGTLRGMHFQWPPSREAKVVRAQRGSALDVAIDLRPGSPSFLRSASVTLDASTHNAIYIPTGCAHGFQTLTDDCDIVYMMSDVYRPELAGGVRYDDRAFGLRWPVPVSTITERDRTFPDFDRARYTEQFHAAERVAIP